MLLRIACLQLLHLKSLPTPHPVSEYVFMKELETLITCAELVRSRLLANDNGSHKCTKVVFHINPTMAPAWGNPFLMLNVTSDMLGRQSD